MTKTEYMNTINEKLTVAEALCANLRKLRILQKLMYLMLLKCKHTIIWSNR